MHAVLDHAYDGLIRHQPLGDEAVIKFQIAGAAAAARARAHMQCYTFYIFSRAGVCQYYHEWSRPRPAAAGAGSQAEDFKLVFGLLWSMKTFAAAMDPKSGPAKKQVGAPARIGDGAAFRSFSTSAFAAHLLEPPSGLKLVLLTSPGAGDMRAALWHVYAALFAELVAKNPLYEPGRPFLFEPFSSALNKYVRALGLAG